MKQLTLAQAALKIESIFKKTVTGIQFEDGSRMAFNYQLEGSGWQFIRLN